MRVVGPEAGDVVEIGLTHNDVGSPGRRRRVKRQQLPRLVELAVLHLRQMHASVQPLQNTKREV